MFENPFCSTKYLRKLKADLRRRAKTNCKVQKTILTKAEIIGEPFSVMFFFGEEE